MPYIPQSSRSGINVNTINIDNAGELNYTITSLVDRYISKKGLSYTNLNEVIGVLECVKLELYRRVAAPYEDQKLDENGDVYTWTKP